MKSKGIAYLLWFFLGGLGIHKFYLHKWGMGIVYIILLILGIFLWIPFVLLCIGLLVDLFVLGTQVDTYNLAHTNNNLIN